MSKFIEVKTAYGNRMLVNLSKILRVYESEKGEPPVISLSDDWDIPLNETYDHFLNRLAQISEVEEI